LAERIRVIENRISLPGGPFDKPLTPPVKVIYVGRGAVEKRIGLIAQVAEACALDNLGVNFTFIGPQIDSWIPKNRKRYCHLTGVITDRAALEHQYRDAHIIILLSAFEGFPVVVMEAMACGVVPLVIDVGGLNVHVKPGINGFLIENSLSEEKIVSDAVNVLRSIARGQENLGRLSKACVEYAREHFRQPGYNEKCRSAIMGEDPSV
jgi:glycosyltransferase involved in cell wall biosynthesis